MEAAVGEDEEAAERRARNLQKRQQQQDAEVEDCSCSCSTPGAGAGQPGDGEAGQLDQQEECGGHLGSQVTTTSSGWLKLSDLELQRFANRIPSFQYQG